MIYYEGLIKMKAPGGRDWSEFEEKERRELTSSQRELLSV